MNFEVQKYIDPFTDFGFKRLFGEEDSKDLLKDFLNELLRDEQQSIVELSYLNNEQLGNSQVDRDAIFDIYCTNENGDRFIVELQKAKQNYFKDRSVFYSTFPIQEQARKGVTQAQLSSCVGAEQCSAFSLLRNFKLKAVYTIGILDFVFDDDKNSDKYLYHVKLTEQQTQQVFYDKLTFIYLAMPKFTKPLTELEDHFDKWLYIFKNMSTMQEVSASLQGGIFDKVFEKARVSQLNRDELYRYEGSLKYYRDAKNERDTAKDEGIEIGREEGIEIGKEIGKEEGELNKSLEIAKNALTMGLAIKDIMQLTGLTVEEIDKISSES